MTMFKHVDGELVEMTPQEEAEFEAMQAQSTPGPLVPDEVMRHQGLLALLEFGITEAMVMAKVDEIEEPVERERTRIRFMQPNWRRDSDFIEWGAEKFSLTEPRVGELFILAATF